MGTLPHMLRRARRRRLANAAFHSAGVGLGAAAGLGLALLVLDRTVGIGARLEVYFVLLGAGLLAGLVHAALTRPAMWSVAVHLDRTLHLQDRLATAEAIRQGRIDDEGLAALARRDAQRVADSIDLRSAAPIRLTGVWAGDAALVALLWLGIAYLPVTAWAAQRPGPQVLADRDAKLQEQRSRLVESITETIAQLDDDVVDEATREQLDALERLATQLDHTPTQSDLAEVRDESAARLDEVAERLSDRAERDLAGIDEVTRRFQGIDAPSTPPGSRELTSALRSGDFDEAAEQLEELLDDAGELTDGQRRELAQHLRTLSERLERASEAANQDTTERREQLEQALRDQGVEEPQIKRILDGEPQGEGEIERDLQRRNVDDDIARQLARDIERLNEDLNRDEQADRDTEAVADALDRAARDVQSPPEQERPEDGPPPSPQRRPEPDAPTDSTADQNDGSSPAPEQPDDGAGSPQRPPGPQEQPDAPAQRPPTSGREPGEPQPGSPETPVPPRNDDQNPPSSGRAGEEPVPGETSPPSGTHDAAGAEAPERQPQAGPDRSPAQTLRELAERRRSGEERHRTAERLRRLARELSEDLTDRERQRWAQSWQRQSTGGLRPDPIGAADPQLAVHDVESVDLRGDEAADRLITEWFGRESGEGAPGRTDRGEARRLIRRAREGAQRAVNESGVPSRYHDLIRRYFGRLEETVRKASTGTPPARTDEDP
ncbi:MAG: hypothetical protein IH804_05600 [Planctomycetes bacterium]|nr:hypothetical protein [Planctomycetota bacterium]